MKRLFSSSSLPLLIVVGALLLIGCGGGGGGATGGVSGGSSSSGGSTGGSTGGATTGGATTGGTTTGSTTGGSTGSTTGSTTGGTTGSGFPFAYRDDSNNLETTIDAAFELIGNRVSIFADYGDRLLGIEIPIPTQVPQTFKLGDGLIAQQNGYGSGDVFLFDQFVALGTTEYPEQNRWFEAGGPGTGTVTVTFYDGERIRGVFSFRAYGLDDLDRPINFGANNGDFDLLIID